MKKKIILLILVLFLMAGCGNKGGGGDVPTITTKDLYTGTDGLEVSFVADNPPEEVYEQSNVAVVFGITNKGMHNIQEGILSIGLEEDYMRMVDGSFQSVLGNTRFVGDNKLNLNINGKELNNPEGGEDQVTFLINTLALDEMSQYHDSSILLTACYSYSTRLSDQICLDTDLFGARMIEKPCEVQDLSHSSQGAPVAITQVEVDMLPDMNNNKVKPQIIIHIRNSGNGEVLLNNRQVISDACSSKTVKFDSWNKVLVNAWMGNEMYFDCHIESENENPTKVGTATLKNKEAKIRCVYEEGIGLEAGTRLEPLVIELGYGYTTSISKKIRLNKIAR